jgi:hypothetical protein
MFEELRWTLVRLRESQRRFNDQWNHAKALTESDDFDTQMRGKHELSDLRASAMEGRTTTLSCLSEFDQAMAEADKIEGVPQSLKEELQAINKEAVGFANYYLKCSRTKIDE